MAKWEIEAVGMRELRKALRDGSSDSLWRAGLREVYGTVAGVVQDEAQGLARAGATTISGTRASMGGDAVASIKGKGTTTGASLQAFKGIPWGMGWNFGSTGRYPQFPAKTDPDLSLYRAVQNKREQVQNEFAEAVEYKLAELFPE